MVSEISENDLDAIYSKFYNEIGKTNNKDLVSFAVPNPNFLFHIFNPKSGIFTLSKREIEPMMSGGMRVSGEVYYERNGEKIGVKVTVEKEKEADVQKETPGNTKEQESPDSRDRDFDRDK